MLQNKCGRRAGINQRRGTAELRGKDLQLEKAVDVLANDVSAWKSRPQPKLKKASELEPSAKPSGPVVRDGIGE